jgi:hypothetical protein
MWKDCNFITGFDTRAFLPSLSVLSYFDRPMRPARTTSRPRDAGNHPVTDTVPGFHIAEQGLLFSFLGGKLLHRHREFGHLPAGLELSGFRISDGSSNEDQLVIHGLVPPGLCLNAELKACTRWMCQGWPQATGGLSLAQTPCMRQSKAIETHPEGTEITKTRLAKAELLNRKRRPKRPTSDGGQISERGQPQQRSSIGLTWRTGEIITRERDRRRCLHGLVEETDE